MDRYIVNSLPPVHIASRPDYAAWERFRNLFGATGVISFDKKYTAQNCKDVLFNFRKSRGVVDFPTSVFTIDEFFNDPNVIQILGQANINFVKEGIKIVEECTVPMQNVPHGMSFFLNLKDLATPLHNHPFDSINDSGPQLVVWSNEKNRLPQFWFEEKGERQYWPDLSKSNVYCVDGKYKHAGESFSCSTIYLISFCRKLNLPVNR
jgi:hypothetical protein